MINNISCTLILPNEVRSDILTNISDLSIYGISIYNDIREIRKSDLEKSKNVVIIGKVQLDMISDLKLYKKIFNLEMFFISMDDLMCNIMSEFCTSFNLDYSRLDYSLLVSVIFNDSAQMDNFKLRDLKPSVNSLRVAQEFVNDPNKPISNLAKDYLVLRESYLNKIELEKSLKTEISKIHSDVLGLTRTNESLMMEIVSLISQYSEHYTKLKDYKIFFTEDVYDIVNLSDYKKRPKVLYFKEYTEFLHFESFINTLCGILKYQLSSSFKVVRLHDSFDVHRIKILESSYFTVNDKFIASDIINNDFILSYGNYIKLFDTILNTPLDYLVVIDCKKFDNLILVGEYLKLNLCRNSKDLYKLNLDPYTTIVNNELNNILSWDTYERYNEFIDQKDRFIYLSSRPVMKKLFDLICDII